MKREVREAYLYEKLSNNKVRCNLCHHRCIIKDGESGICRVRKNEGGTLYTLVYGLTIAKHIDPIEKKPLYHFYPGSDSLSIATVGCNFVCPWCQNWQIAQMVRDSGRLRGEWLPPEEVVATAKRAGCRSISYTYTEPTIFFEYAYDTAKLAVEEGIENTFVSNGYMTPEAVEMIKPYLQAINVDLKAFSKEVYSKTIGGRLDRVLETIRTLKKAGIWLELTTLIVPNMNDDEAQLKGIVDFIADVDVSIPWHISRYHPAYKYSTPPATPVETLHKARDLAKEAGLRYIYIGNIHDETGGDTYCYKCGRLLIKRWGFTISQNHIEDSKCPTCGTRIDGVGL